MGSGPLPIPAPTGAAAYPPTPLALPAGEVHLWIADLSVAPPDGDEPAASWLDDAERERADRFAGRAGRRRFVRSRAGLRRILGGYLGRPPGDLRLGIGAEGKPYLVDPGGRPQCDLRFNLSHAEDVWVLAVRRDAEVGVDVERTGRSADVSGVAGRMFAAGERAAIERLPETAAGFAFFRIWSTREAVVKCLGAGMFSLDVDFEVEADPERPLAVRPARAPAPGESLPWVGEIPLRAGFVAVLATRDEPRAVRTWAVPDGS